MIFSLLLKSRFLLVCLPYGQNLFLLDSCFRENDGIKTINFILGSTFGAPGMTSLS
jgi:hypothetical protein